MKVSGERQFEAPRATVWEVLNDPAQMAKTMPGVESFDIQDDRHWRAHVKIPLGLGGLRMSIDFEKMEEREPEFAKLHAKGNGVGAIMNMDTSFNLSEADGGTNMRWEADVHILGPVASMGAGMALGATRETDLVALHRAAVAEPGRLVLVADVDGEIAGMAHLAPSTAANAPHRAEVQRVAVTASARGTGV